MYRPNETTDDSWKFPYYYRPAWEEWKPPYNVTWNYPQCLICKFTFYNVNHFNQVQTPDGDVIGYLCPTCGEKYAIEIKRKDE